MTDDHGIRFEDLGGQFKIEREPEGRPAFTRSAGAAGVGPDYQDKVRRLGEKWRGILGTAGAHSYASASECDFATVCALVKRGFTDGEIIETLEASARYADRVERKGERHTRELFEVEIAKARGMVAPFPERSANGNHAPVPPGSPPGRRPVVDGQAASFRCSDAGNAELFVSMFGDRYRYDWRRGVLLAYHKHWWEVDTGDRSCRDAILVARQRFVQALNITDESERKRQALFALQSENRGRIESMLAIARALHPITDDGKGWDADPWALGVENGIVDLRTGELRDGRPEDKISRHAPVSFDASATAPTFERFIAEILPQPELRVYLQKLAGIALSGDVSSQVLAFLYGVGANGKTTLAQALLELLGGDYGKQAAPGLLLRKKGETHPTEIADLHGARLVVSVEVEDGRALAEALVKQMTGGDMMKARFMHGDFFQWRPTHKIWLLANHRPIVRGTDHAIWRRIRLIPFDVVVPEERRDPRLAEKLQAEAAGILNWAIAGCMLWQREGLKDPPAVLLATEDYRTDSDPLQPFIDAECVTHPTASVGGSVLFKTYKRWAEDAGLSGRETLTANAFGRKVGERFEKRVLDGRRLYAGIGLRQVEHQGEMSYGD